MSLRATQHASWSTVDPTAWDALVGDASPFLEHAWLHGLEKSGCTIPELGWHPCPITVHDGGRLVAGLPAYEVHHDRGQFVYQDHWKRAADDAELPLHPKILIGVPFTPVTGSRRLLAPDATPETRKVLLSALARRMRDCHGLHVLFPDEAELPDWEAAGLFRRMQYQFHWQNRDYASFEAFLGAFRSKRRKDIRRERSAVTHLRFETLVSPGPATVDLLWEAYSGTVERHGGTDRFLNRAFFEHLAGTWKDRIVAICAWDGERFVGGAFNVVKGERLYGRYWGLVEPVPFLHFEVCYHRGVEYCIAEKLAAYEPGHGGEHKFRRGFEPVPTWSAHRFPHAGAQHAFSRAARREQAWFETRIAERMAHSPLKGG